MFESIKKFENKKEMVEYLNDFKLFRCHTNFIIVDYYGEPNCVLTYSDTLLIRAKYNGRVYHTKEDLIEFIDTVYDVPRRVRKCGKGVVDVYGIVFDDKVKYFLAVGMSNVPPELENSETLLTNSSCEVRGMYMHTHHTLPILRDDLFNISEYTSYSDSGNKSARNIGEIFSKHIPSEKAIGLLVYSTDYWIGVRCINMANIAALYVETPNTPITLTITGLTLEHSDNGDGEWDGVYYKPRVSVEPYLHRGFPIKYLNIPIEKVISRKMRVGDEVKVIVAGNTHELIEHVKCGKGELIKLTHTCVHCNYPLVYNGITPICNNTFGCGPQLIKAVRNIVRREALAIPGMYTILVAYWIEEDHLNETCDLLSLIVNSDWEEVTEGMMTSIEFKELQTHTLDAVQEATLANKLMAFGIAGVTSELAETICEEFLYLTQIHGCSLESLYSIKQLPKEVAEEIHRFFNHPENQDQIIRFIKDLD